MSGVVAWLGVNLADAMLTLLIISLGGGELNPIIRKVIEASPALFLIYKLGIAGLVAWLYFRFRKQERLMIPTACLGLIVVWNIGVCVSKVL